MKITEAIKNKILGFLGLENLTKERYYENDVENLRTYAVMENRTWYMGDMNKIRYFYTKSEWCGVLASNPIYNLNRANYFCAIANGEKTKMVHSGIPKAIVNTLCSVMGMPDIKVEGMEEGALADFRKKTRIDNTIYKKQLPLTLAEGWGAFKVNISSRFKDYPTIEFYEAKDVDFIVRDGITIGIIYRDYYTQGNRDYILMETRRLDGEGNSLIEYELFRVKGQKLEPSELSEVESLRGLRNITIRNYDRIFGVPCRLIDDPDNPDYGESVFAGRIDLFDDLDQSLSQRSETSRCSTPVEYYPVEFMKRGNDGQKGFPSVFCRKYVEIPAIADGDGNMNAHVQTTQPQLNFEQYTSEQVALVNQILIGLLSPATMGIDISRKDNADAQREKEKVTETTRNNLIAPERDIIEDIYSLALDAQEFMQTGTVRGRKKISVSYPQFASPSFEGKAKALLPLFSGDAISDEMYVDKLYGDQLTDEQKSEEVGRIRKKRESDSTDVMDQLMGSERKDIDEDRHI